MNFPSPLPSLVLCVALHAQVVDVKPQGGGDLKIGNTLYRFELMNLRSAPAKGGLPGAVKLQGRLVAKDGTPDFQLDLTVLKNGSIYMLNIHRKASGAYPDNWAATQKTHTRALVMEVRAGGRIELRCEGRLTGIIARQPREAPWSGTLWAVFPGAPGEGPDQALPEGQKD
ncbi:MAG: hypothetical protein Q8K67_11940 [Geothrix sp.]|nr:hypothetical protein [Geothrix sp.]